MAKETKFGKVSAPGGFKSGAADLIESELEQLDGVTPGTAAASKALVADANKDVRGVGIGHKVTVASADGAIAVKTGVVVITKAGVAALTLADPTDVTDDGCELLIISATAHAHTVSNAAGSGFNGSGSGADVGTFGGAKGDNMRLVAYGGDWHVVSLRNVTLG
jgi:hypothetical protein